MRASMVFTATGASSPGSSAMLAASCRTASGSGCARICGTDSARLSSHAASIRMRSRISPLSDSTMRRPSADLRYRPSTGESALSAEESMQKWPRNAVLNSRAMISDTRIEHDSFGDIEVAATALWGAQTERARRNFLLGGGPMPQDFIVAVALIKGAAARANARLGLLPPEIAGAIDAAVRDIERLRHVDQFPVDVYQTGSGTSTNMNVNEVIATLASRTLGKTVHPNDHVNMCQSSNDVIQ